MLHGELWVVDGGYRGRSERLDAITNQWVRGPDMDSYRSSFGLAVFNGQLWAVGGAGMDGDAIASCEYLDAASNTWMAGPAMTTTRKSHGLAVLDGQLWAIGGKHTAASTSLAGHEDLVSTEYLDATTNVWVAGPDIPAPTFNLMCAVK